MTLIIDINLRLNGGRNTTRELTDVSSNVRRMGDNARTASNGVGGINTQLQRLATYAAGFFVFDKLTEYAGKAIQLADGWAMLNAKMVLATGSSKDAKIATGELYSLAQDLRVPLTETATLYGRIVPALKEYGGGTAEAMRITEAMSLSLKVSGATQAESASAMLQFSQAMGAGALRGEEFNAMADASPRLLQALADGMGVSRGELKKLAEQGKLTTDVVYSALSKQLPKLRGEFSQLPMTVGDAWTKLGNAALKGIGEFNEGAGITTTLAGAIDLLANNLPVVGNSFVLMAQGAAAYFAIVRGGPLLMAGTATSLTTLRTLLDRLHPAAMTGATVWQRLNNLFFTSPGIIDRCSTAMGALKVVGGVLFAFFAGWQIGSYLEENFAWARNAGIFFVSGTLKGFEHLKFGVLATWEVIKYGFGAVGDFIKKAMAGTIDFIATMAEKVGATSLASKLRGWAAGFQESGGSAQQLRESLLSLSAARDKELGFIDQNISEMLDESDARGKVTTATGKQQKATDNLKGTTKASAEDTKKLKTEYTKLTESLTAQTASLTLTKNGQAQLTATQKLTAEATEFLTKVGDQLTVSEKQKLQAFVANLPVLEKQAAATEKLREAEADYTKKLESGLSSLQSRLEQATEDRENMGKSESQIVALGVARDRETLSVLLNKQALEGHSEELDKQIDIVKQRIATGEQLQEKLKDKEGFEAQEAQLKANAEKWNAWADEIGKSFTAGFERMLETGKGFWEAFTESLKNTFKKGLVDWLYTTFAKPFLLKIALAGSGSLSANGAVAGGTAGGGVLSSATNLVGLIKGGAGASIAKFGTSIASLGSALNSSAIYEFGVGMADPFAAAGSGGAAGFGAQVGTALPVVAGIGGGILIGRAISGEYSVGESIGGNKNTAVVAGTAIGAAIGSVIPVIGTAIGAVVGGTIGGIVNRAFGMGEKKTEHIGIEGGFTSFGFYGQNYAMWEQDGGWFRSDKNGTDYSPVSEEMANVMSTGFSAMKDSITGYAKSLGLVTGINASAAIAGYKKNFTLELTDDEAANAQKITDLFTGMADDMAVALLPNVRRWEKAGETASVTFQRLAGVFDVTNAAANLLGANLETAFSGIGINSADARLALIDFSGGLEAFSQKVGFYYDNFYTDAEKTARAYAELDAKFDLLGLNIGLDKAAFRTELEKVNAADNPTQYAALLDLAPLFTQVLTAMGDSAADQRIGVGISAKGMSEKQLAAINESAAAWFSTYQKPLAEQLLATNELAGVEQAITASNGLLGDILSITQKAAADAMATALAAIKSATAQSDILWRWETQGMPQPRPE